MKKFAALMVAFALALSFAACGGKEPQQTETVPQVSDVLVRSTYNEENGCFTNGYTQLTAAVPGDWYIYTDSDHAASYLKAEVTGDEFSMWRSADFENKTLIPDFAVQDLANSNNLSVVYVNLENMEYAEYMDEETFHTTVIQHMSQQGRVLNQTDNEIISICDKDFYLFRFKDADTDWYMAMRRQDNYMIVITATDRSGAGEDLFFGYFE